MNLAYPKVTLLYAGIFGFFYLALAFYVIYFRIKEKTSLGHSTDPNSKLFRAVRIHANFMEYVPFIIFLMFLDEATGASEKFICYLGLSLFLGRVVYFFAIRKIPGRSIGRGVGIFATFTSLAVLCVRLIMKGLA
jgi:uncharacterized protein